MNSHTRSLTSDSERCDGCGRILESGDEGLLSLKLNEAAAASPAASESSDTAPLSIIGCPNPAMPDFLAKISESLSRCQCGGRVSAGLARMLQSLSEKVHQGDAIPTLFGPENLPVSPWPVQVMLIPSNAPYLQNADLLVMGNCIPQLFPALPKELLKGKVVMMGCPGPGQFRAPRREVFPHMPQREPATHHYAHHGSSLLRWLKFDGGKRAGGIRNEHPHGESGSRHQRQNQGSH